VAQATIVYDTTQGICWLADANLGGNSEMQASLGVTGINPNGSMDYATALRWVAALNAYNNGAVYLDHNNWQLPVAPLVDHSCADVGANGGRLVRSAPAVLSGTCTRWASNRLSRERRFWFCRYRRATS
jgi:hypothetical protein